MIITFLGHSSLSYGESLSKNIRNVIDKNIENVDNVLFYCGDTEILTAYVHRFAIP